MSLLSYGYYYDPKSNRLISNKGYNSLSLKEANQNELGDLLALNYDFNGLKNNLGFSGLKYKVEYNSDGTPRLSLYSGSLGIGALYNNNRFNWRFGGSNKMGFWKNGKLTWDPDKVAKKPISTDKNITDTTNPTTNPTTDWNSRYTQGGLNKDLNGDGVIDSRDAGIFQEYYNAKNPNATQLVVDNKWGTNTANAFKSGNYNADDISLWWKNKNTEGSPERITNEAVVTGLRPTQTTQTTNYTNFGAYNRGLRNALRNGQINSDAQIWTANGMQRAGELSNMNRFLLRRLQRRTNRLNQTNAMLTQGDRVNQSSGVGNSARDQFASNHRLLNGSYTETTPSTTTNNTDNNVMNPTLQNNINNALNMKFNFEKPKLTLKTGGLIPKHISGAELKGLAQLLEESGNAVKGIKSSANELNYGNRLFSRANLGIQKGFFGKFSKNARSSKKALKGNTNNTYSSFNPEDAQIGTPEMVNTMKLNGRPANLPSNMHMAEPLVVEKDGARYVFHNGKAGVEAIPVDYNLGRINPSEIMASPKAGEIPMQAVDAGLGTPKNILGGTSQGALSTGYMTPQLSGITNTGHVKLGWGYPTTNGLMSVMPWNNAWEGSVNMTPKVSGMRFEPMGPGLKATYPTPPRFLVRDRFPMTTTPKKTNPTWTDGGHLKEATKATTELAKNSRSRWLPWYAAPAGAAAGLLGFGFMYPQQAQAPGVRHLPAQPTPPVIPPVKPDDPKKSGGKSNGGNKEIEIHNFDLTPVQGAGFDADMSSLEGSIPTQVEIPSMQVPQSFGLTLDLIVALTPMLQGYYPQYSPEEITYSQYKRGGRLIKRNK